MDVRLGGMLEAVDGLANVLQILGVILLAVLYLKKRKVKLMFLAVVVRGFSFNVIYKRKDGSLLVKMRVGGLALSLWLTTYYKRRK